MILETLERPRRRSEPDLESIAPASNGKRHKLAPIEPAQDVLSDERLLETQAVHGGDDVAVFESCSRGLRPFKRGARTTSPFSESSSSQAGSVGAEIFLTAHLYSSINQILNLFKAQSGR